MKVCLGEYLKLEHQSLTEIEKKLSSLIRHIRKFHVLDPVYMEWGTPVSGVGFFCFHALEDTKQKKLTPLDRGPPLHVNRVLVMQ